MVSTDHIQSDLFARLQAVRQKLRRREVLFGVILVSLVSLGVALAASILEAAFHFEASGRTALFWSAFACIFGALTWYIGRPLLRLLGFVAQESDAEVAVMIGKAFPRVHDHLLNGLQLLEERMRGFYSAVLIEAALQDLQTEVSPIDFRSAVTYAISRKLARVLLGAGAAAVLLMILFPGPLVDSAHRLWHHSEAFASPQLFSFVVEPGDKEIVKGESVAIMIHVIGQQQQQIVLGSRRDREEVEEHRNLDRRSDGMFRYEFVALKSTTQYRVSAGGVESPTFRLTVVDRPVAKLLRIGLRFPTYSSLAPKQLDDNVGDIVALKGTRASFFLEASKELREATLVFGDSTRAPLRVYGTRATGEFTLMKDHSYQIALTDSEGAANAEPIQYAVKILEDAYPTAAILVPGTNLDVTDKTVIPMLFKISDDYGFSRLRLAYQLVQSRYATPSERPTFIDIPFSPGKGGEMLVPYSWSLAGLNLVPEDAVKYYIEVSDNDMVSGPKSAVSETYTVRYPSVDEVFAETDKDQDKALEVMRDAMTQVDEAKRNLEELRQDLRQEKQKADWQDQKKAEEVAKQYQELQKNMAEVAKTIDKTMNQLQKNQLLSPETLAKYQELQQLMQQMNSPELADALKRLQQAMQQLNAEQLKQALNQFSLSEENFRKSIERTLNLLKRIQIEQKVDEMVKRAEAMARAQEELRKKTEPASKEQLPELAQQQQDLRRNAEDLGRELAELQKKMEDFPGEMPVKETQQTREELEQSKLDEQLQEIAQEMRDFKTEQALQGQQQAQQKMSRVAQQMQQAKKAMQQKQQQQVVNEMRRVLQDLLEISRREEELKKETQSLEQNSARFRNQAQGQMETIQDLGVVLDRLNGLSNKTFSVSPEMGKSLGEAVHNMGAAMQSLDQRNGNAAGAQQSAAMGALNEAAIQVQNALNGMMQSGGEGAMGMSNFLKRLQGLTSRQQDINQQTQGLTPQQAEAAGRLAAEQGAVRKSLEQLAREASNSGQLKKMLGDLQKTAEEMREVQTDLAQGEVNPETIKRQERILSRLLDSQRSTRERDFENKRRAQTGTNVVRDGPGPIDLSTQEAKGRLRHDLLRALDEGYSREYEDLIRKYFEVLEQ